MRPILLALLTLLVTLPALAADSLESLRAHFHAARRGDAAALETGLAAAEAFLARHPGDAVTRSYRGALLAVQAREAVFPWNQLAYANDALAELDAAQAGPVVNHDGRDGQLELTIVRAATLANFPSSFERDVEARAGLAAAIAHPLFDGIRPWEKALVLAWQAVHAHRDGDAATAAAWLAKARAADAAEADRIWEKR